MAGQIALSSLTQRQSSRRRIARGSNAFEEDLHAGNWQHRFWWRKEVGLTGRHRSIVFNVNSPSSIARQIYLISKNTSS